MCSEVPYEHTQNADKKAHLADIRLRSFFAPPPVGSLTGAPYRARWLGLRSAAAKQLHGLRADRSASDLAGREARCTTSWSVVLLDMSVIAPSSGRASTGRFRLVRSSQNVLALAQSTATESVPVTSALWKDRDINCSFALCIQAGSEWMNGAVSVRRTRYRAGQESPSGAPSCRPPSLVPSLGSRSTTLSCRSLVLGPNWPFL